MRMILIDRGLWEMVDGTSVRPTLVTGDDSSRVKLLDWTRKDNTALAQIALTVGTNELVHIKAAKSSSEAWIKICAVFEQKGFHSKIFLRRKFLNAKLTEGTRMQTHINYITGLAEQLNAIGATVTDDDIGMTLLTSLPDSYDPLIMALESRPINELTSEFIAGRLLEEEKRRQESANPIGIRTSETVLLSNQSSAGFKRNVQKCTFCKRTNHTEAECYRKHGWPAGHPLSNKPNVANLTVTKGTEGTSNDISQNDDYTAFTVNMGHDLTKNEWLIDSGASAHYSNNRN